MKTIKEWFNKIKVFVMNILRGLVNVAKKAKELTKDVVEGVKEGLQNSNEKQLTNNDEFKKAAMEFGKEIIEDKNKRTVIGNIIIAVSGGIVIFGCAGIIIGIGIRLS